MIQKILVVPFLSFHNTGFGISFTLILLIYIFCSDGQNKDNFYLACK
jgi:hypothetical protein